MLVKEKTYIQSHYMIMSVRSLFPNLNGYLKELPNGRVEINLFFFLFDFSTTYDRKSTYNELAVDMCLYNFVINNEKLYSEI